MQAVKIMIERCTCLISENGPNGQADYMGTQGIRRSVQEPNWYAGLSLSNQKLVSEYLLRIKVPLKGEDLSFSALMRMSSASALQNSSMDIELEERFKTRKYPIYALDKAGCKDISEIYQSLLNTNFDDATSSLGRIAILLVQP